jgi:hypothetical protein
MKNLSAQEKQILFYAVIFIVVYYLVIRPLFIKVGLKKDPEVLATEERKQEQIATQIKEIAKTQKPTKSSAEWQVIADQIYSDLRYSAVSDNKADAGYQVARVKNDADFWELYRLFGKRREYLFGIPQNLQDLSQFIRSNLSEKAIKTINNNYASKGIKFRF